MDQLGQVRQQAGADAECVVAGTLKKLCGLCGEPLHPHFSKLSRHSDRHHQGRAIAFLKMHQVPERLRYLNLPQFLADPSVKLIQDPDTSKAKAGRPKKSEQPEEPSEIVES